MGCISFLILVAEAGFSKLSLIMADPTPNKAFICLGFLRFILSYFLLSEFCPSLRTISRRVPRLIFDFLQISNSLIFLPNDHAECTVFCLKRFYILVYDRRVDDIRISNYIR